METSYYDNAIATALHNKLLSLSKDYIKFHPCECVNLCNDIIRYSSIDFFTVITDDVNYVIGIIGNSIDDDELPF